MADASRNLNTGFNVNQFNASAELKSGFTVKQWQESLIARFIVCPIFEDDFEDGTFDKWDSTATSAGCTLTVIVPKKGARYRGVRFAQAYTDDNWEAARAIITRTPYPELFISLGARTPALPAVGESRIFIYVEDHLNNVICWVALGNVGGNYFLQVRDIVGAATYSWQLPADYTAYLWDHIQLKVKDGNGDGELLLWVDGILVINQTLLNTSTAGDQAIISIGQCFGHAGTVQFDDVKVCSHYIISDYNQGRLNLGQCGFVVRHAASANLSSGFTVKQGIENIHGKMFVVNKGTLNLKSGFDGQVSLNITSSFSVRRSFTKDLAAGFLVLFGFESLSSKFVARPELTYDMKGGFISRLSASGNRKAYFITRNQSSQNLGAGFIVKGPASQNLKAGFRLIQILDLKGSFEIAPILNACEEPIIEDGITAWINYRDCIGTGFLTEPAISDSTKYKAAGADSAQILIEYLPEKYKEIAFGHNWQPYNTCPVAFWVGGGGSSAVLKLISTLGRIEADLSSELQTIVTEGDAAVTFLRTYEGVLWIGTNKGHVISYSDGVFTDYSSELNIGANTVYRIVYNGAFFMVATGNPERILLSWTPGLSAINHTSELQTQLRYLVYEYDQKRFDRIQGLAYNKNLDKWMVGIRQDHFRWKGGSTTPSSYYGFPVLFECDGSSLSNAQAMARPHSYSLYDVDTCPEISYFLIAMRQYGAGKGYIEKYTDVPSSFTQIIQQEDWPQVLNLQDYDYQLLGFRTAEDYPLWKRVQEGTPGNFSNQVVVEPKAIAQCTMYAMIGGADKLVSLMKETVQFWDISAASGMTDIRAIASRTNWRYSL